MSIWLQALTPSPTPIPPTSHKRGFVRLMNGSGHALRLASVAFFAENHKRDPQFARACLDCTERRYHLAGPLGSAMFARLRELKWIASIPHTRTVRVTLQGERKFSEVLGLNGRMR